MKILKHYCWIILVIMLLDNDVIGQSDEEDLCRLPEDLQSTATRQQEITISLLDILRNGTSELFTGSPEGYQDVTLILGNTGCGKTTLTKMVTGDLTKLHAVESKTGNLIVIDDERTISEKTISKTLVPILIFSRERDQAYFDCPGFDDNRGSLADLAANYFIHQIFSKVNRVKFLFLAPHISVLQGQERTGFDLLAQHATTLLKDIQTFKESVALVVTKVETKSGHRKRPKSDKQIIASVVAFLRQYRQDTVHKSERQDRVESHRAKDMQKIKFVDILLETRNGEYNKITISKGPKYCGPLSQSEEVKDTRTRVLRLIDDMSYGNVGNPKDNFGFSLKDSTKDEVKSTYTREVNEAVSAIIQNEMNSVLEWHSSKYDLSVDNFHLLRAIWDNLENLKFPSDRNISTIANEIVSWLHPMGYDKYGDFEKQMKEKQTIFDFFDTVTGSNVEVTLNDWKVIVQETQRQMRVTMEQEIHKMTKTTNDNIVRDVSNLMASFQNGINKQLKNINVTSSLQLCQNAYIQLERIENKANVDDYGNDISGALSQMNYPVTAEFQRNCSRYEAVLAYLETVKPQMIDRSQIRWTKPIEDAKKQMYELKTWYDFCAKVEQQLSSWEFQRSKPDEFNPHDKHWTEFLKSVDKISVSPEAEQIGESLREKKSHHFKKLKDIVKAAFAGTQSTRCESSDTLVVTGRFVQIGKLLKNDGTLNPWPCRDVKNLEVYATDKLFIDANLPGHGKNLVVSFVAPTWEIVSQARINLNGVDGKKNVAAANGRMTTQNDEDRFSKPARKTFRRLVSTGHDDPFNLASYDSSQYEVDLKRQFKDYLKNLRNGSDGWPGEPGGPAGSFQGVADSIINANKLSITAVGGDGGDGARGGNGAKGTDRKARQIDDFQWYHFVQIHGSHEGTYGEDGDDGGNGGSGGIAGDYGRGGYVNVHSKDSSKVQTTYGNGRSGRMGLGGAGGIGGKGENGIYCKKNRVFWLQVSKTCYDSLASNGKNGLKGKDGAITSGKRTGENARTGRTITYLRERFNHWFYSDGIKAFF